MAKTNNKGFTLIEIDHSCCHIVSPFNSDFKTICQYPGDKPEGKSSPGGK